MLNDALGEIARALGLVEHSRSIPVLAVLAGGLLLPLLVALLTRHRLCVLETIVITALALLVLALQDGVLAITLMTFALINAARGFERSNAAEFHKRSHQRLQNLDDTVNRFLTGLDRRTMAQESDREQGFPVSGTSYKFERS